MEGHTGTWYTIDYTMDDSIIKDFNAECIFALEHEEYGDEAPCILVDQDGNIIMDDAWNGLPDLLDIEGRN